MPQVAIVFTKMLVYVRANHCHAGCNFTIKFSGL